MFLPVRIIITFVAAVTLCLTGMPTASAAQYSPEPQSTWSPNGRVYALVVSQGRVYIGGSFTSVRGPNGENVPREHLAAFDAVSGDLVRTWAPTTNAVVRSLAVEGGRVLVGGDFTVANGSPAEHLAAFGSVTGGLVWQAGANSRVRDVLLVGQRLFVAGNFRVIGGQRRRGLAQLNTVDGSVVAGWKAKVGGGVPFALTLAPNGQDLVLGGNFDSVNAQPRSFLASVSLGSAEVTAWAPPAACSTCRIWDVAEDSFHVYAATAGPGGRLVAYSGDGGDQLWKKQADGDIQAVDAYDGMVYAGGHFSPDFDGVVRHQLAVVVGATGRIDGYAPAFAGRAKPGIWAVAAGPDGLRLGGGFTRIGSTTQKRYAQFPVTLG